MMLLSFRVSSVSVGLALSLESFQSNFFISLCKCVWMNCTRYMLLLLPSFRSHHLFIFKITLHIHTINRTIYSVCFDLFVLFRLLLLHDLLLSSSMAGLICLFFFSFLIIKSLFHTFLFISFDLFFIVVPSTCKTFEINNRSMEAIFRNKMKKKKKYKIAIKLKMYWKIHTHRLNTRRAHRINDVAFVVAYNIFLFLLLLKFFRCCGRRRRRS